MTKDHKSEEKDAHKELEKIEVEKEKWSLAKHKVDMVVGIVKDVILLIVIIAGTLHNILTNAAPKAVEAVANLEASGSGMGSGGGVHVLHSAAPVVHHAHPKLMLTAETIIWVVVIIAIVFYVLPKVQSVFPKVKDFFVKSFIKDKSPK